MTDILSAVVLKFNCINKISCSLISAVEAKYPHLLFPAGKSFQRTAYKSQPPATAVAYLWLSCKYLIVLNQNYKLITSH